MTSPSGQSRRLPSVLTLAAFAAFAAFGVFWGAWGAALPAIRAQAGVSEGQLGTALLFIGIGALPAMAVTGRMLDRFGLRLTSVLLVLLGAAGLAVGFGARDSSSLIIGMLIVGTASGAADVAINTLAGHAENQAGRPVLTRAHGAFSLAVVAASLGAGILLSRVLTVSGVFVVIACLVVVFAVIVGTLSRPGHSESIPAGNVQERPRTVHGMGIRVPPALVTLGLIGALAYATENAHQSWGAVLLTDVFMATPEVAALAPATFAGAAAVTRFALAPLSRSHPLPLLIIGGTVATVGSALVALAPNTPLALTGLAIAAAGTATLFPTLLSYSWRDIPAGLRGRATSTIATTAYLGFLLGPAYVGFIAGTLDLRAAILGVAAVALLFTATAAPVSQWAGRRLRP